MTSPELHQVSTGQLGQAFAPIHKLALGVAVGIVSGILVFLMTMGHWAIGPRHGLNLWLLGQYFYGYTVTPAGAVVGLLWGFVTGCIAGWFLAFVCNLAVAVTIFSLRTKAELSQTSDFLDHI